MQTIVGVRFKKAGKIYYFSPGRLEINLGDAVIVETARGVEYGKVVLGPKEVEDDAAPAPVKLIQRKATEADTERVETNKLKEKEAFAICEKKIEEHELSMKLVDVEYTFDVNKIVFYFTAEGRIDFRDLVKDLASVFRTRIELRQIGVRDEAKLIGGMGGCGRPLCCASFLGDFEPVSIRMAKEQNLSLNPAKISGICGRLMCCLKFENECYCERFPKKERPKPPAQGSRVVTMEGAGRVISLNMQRRSATILLDDSKTVVASWEDVVEKEEPQAVDARFDDETFDVDEAEAVEQSEKPNPNKGRQPKDNVSKKNRHQPRKPMDIVANIHGEGDQGRPHHDGPREFEHREHRPKNDKRHRPPRRDGQRGEQPGGKRRDRREGVSRKPAGDNSGEGK